MRGQERGQEREREKEKEREKENKEKRGIWARISEERSVSLHKKRKRGKGS